MTIQTVYLKSVYELDRYQRTVDKTMTAAEELLKKYSFDTLAFSGMSGAAMSFVLSHKLNLPLLCVRKMGDNSHFHNYYRESRFLEGNLEARRYLIVDDFIATGKTVNYIATTIKKEVPQAECVAILLYAEPHSRTWELAYEKNYFSKPIEVMSSIIEE